MSIQMARRGAIAHRHGTQTGIQPYPGWWYSTLAGVPLGAMGDTADSGTATANALRLQWDYWDAAGGGGLVVSAASEGMPAPPDGDTLVKWYEPFGDVGVYKKLNRTLTSANWPAASGYPVTGGTSPADISARYIGRFYIPSSLFTLNPGGLGWIILMEMKENYTDASNAWHQDPAYGIGGNNFTLGGGVVSVSFMGGTHSGPVYQLSQFMDKWVTWEMRLYQGSSDTSGHGGRIEWWSDGVLLDTAYENEGCHIGSAFLAPDLAHTSGWIWIMGQYTSNQRTDYVGTSVTSYMNGSYILPLSTAGNHISPNPATISGLRGWWKADNITSPPADGGALQNWTDSAGGYTATQATGGNQPTYRTSGAFLPNGNPVLEFTAANATSMLATLAQNTATTRFMVFRPKTIVDCILTSSPLSIGFDPTGKLLTSIENVTWLIQSGGAATFVAGTWYVATVSDDGSTSDTTYVNGTQDATSSTSHSNTGTSLSIGQKVSAGASFDGYLAEILDYSRVLTLSERAAVHTYLQDKYAITVADYVL